MALTRDYKETVVARIKRDRKFARALYAEALNAFRKDCDANSANLREFKSGRSHSRQLAKFASTPYPCSSVVEAPFWGLRSDTILTRKTGVFRCEPRANR